MHRYFVLILSILIFSCERTLTQEELEAYILEPSHGLIQSSEARGLRVEVLLRPGSLIAYQEYKQQNSSLEIKKQAEEKYKHNLYFTVNVSQDQQDPLYKLGDVSRYRKVLQELAFRMSSHARLISSAGDTVAVADYAFPHLYGMSDAVSVLFAFPADSLATYNWLELEWNDPGFGSGDQKFRFAKNDIENIPELKWE
ncbi:MAG TPA: hypothetical protein VNB90_01300 [Cytophagaceae bacterium]|nr:hypothetical protein [Cytophagaceae bacterium]